MNRKRQEIEAGIYARGASGCCPAAGGRMRSCWPAKTGTRAWSGIVASRLAEEYSCPTFLICLDGDKGKASSRSHGGFNLFAALKSLAPLLESYGGHELAAGFTIRREHIDTFREEISRMARQYAARPARVSADSEDRLRDTRRSC